MTTARLITPLLVAVALLLGCAASAQAAGTYQVNYGAGLGPGWSTTPMLGIGVSGNTISTNGRALAVESTGGLRFDTGWDDLVVAGGTVDITFSTVTALRAQMHLGDWRVFSELGTAQRTIAVPTTGSDRTLSVALYVNSAFNGQGSNELRINAAGLVLRDLTRPAIQADHVPSPTRWSGPNDCVRIDFDMEDSESGILAYRLRTLPGNETVASWSMAPAAGLRPGVRSQRYSNCIPGSVRPDGTGTFDLVVTNGAGDVSTSKFSLLTDRTAPTITGGPAERVDFEAPFEMTPFTVRDTSGSGVARIDAKVDGVAVATSITETGSATLASGALGVGIHVIEFSATDAVGNVASLERRIHVIDTTAPVLERLTPGNGGGVQFALLLRATDAVSGIRASSWTATVNGSSIPGSGDAEHFRATVESLAPGVHRIEASVSDLAGNRTTIAFTYVADVPDDLPPDIASQVTQIVTSQTAQAVAAATGGAAGPTAPGSAGAASSTSADGVGAWVVRGANTSATFGMPVEATVFVARAGRAVAGRRVAVQRAGVELATVATGADGLARIGYSAGAPGEYRLVVEGLDSIVLQVAIAPRVLMKSARTARRGAKVRVSGRVQPALSGHPLVLEARSGSGWFVVRRGLRTARGGTFATTFTANARGKFQLRVRVAAHAGWQTATSTTTQSLTVR